MNKIKLNLGLNRNLNLNQKLNLGLNLNLSLILSLSLLVALLFTGCKKQLHPTSIEIKDSIRHYYAIKQGEELTIKFQVTNKGPHPLVIKEIQTSCGCIIVDDDSRIIVPVDGKRDIQLKYNSTKNIGYVSHTVWLYGNILSNGVAKMKFDLNVVPDADYTRDYEQLYEKYKEKNGFVKEAVDGKTSERVYYTKEP